VYKNISGLAPVKEAIKERPIQQYINTLKFIIKLKIKIIAPFAKKNHPKEYHKSFII